jgi:DNA replication and repair protein RecF
VVESDAPVAPPGAPTRIERLALSDFRNYDSLALAFDGRSVVLFGANGAGKTNLLEAISMLAPGRGLRRARLVEATRAGAPGGWGVAARIAGPLGRVDLRTGVESGHRDGESRIARVDREARPSTGAFAQHLALLWLTPDLDGLFRASAGERRRYLDRLALALDAGHAQRVAALERLHRSRNRLLEAQDADAAWLDAVERELAETAVAVAAMRASAVARLTACIERHRDPHSPFPHAVLALSGEVDAWLATASAAEVEDRYRASLREARPRDRAAGRGTFGPHLSDLEVRHGPKDAPAGQASTGEQKALLVGLALAQVRLVAETSARLPVVLLDEVAAHLDAIRRAALFEEIERLGVQAFMTGTDRGMFDAIARRAQFFEVVNGRVSEAAEEH